jgi:putative ABC transport system permease protein
MSQLLETALQDIRYAFRGFRRRPLSALTTILMLALAIGGNSAIFSMIRAVLLRPLPWPDPDRLVILWETNQKQGATRVNPSSANFFDWRERSHSFETLAHWRFVYFNLSGNARFAPERVQGARVAVTFLPLLGAQPVLGRAFSAEEEQPGREQVAILSHGFWQRRFGSSANLLGQQVQIDGDSVKVVGILPPEFHLRVMNRDLDVYMPFAYDRGHLSREDHSLNVYGRLRKGVSLAAAEAEMNSLAERLEQEFPVTNRDWRVHLVSLPEAAVVNSRAILLTLQASVGIVLLIACVNIANLMLSRTNSRAREFAVRVAVGGSRGRVMRQLLTESLILGLLGGAVGLLFAFWVLPVLKLRITYLGLPRIDEFRVDVVVLGFTVLVSLFAGLLFGVAPAFRCARVDITALRAGVTGAVRPRGDLLMFTEVVLTTMLLIAGAAVLKGALQLVRMNRGLDVHQVLTMQIWLPEAKYSSPQKLANFFEQLLPRVRGLPGVESASVVNYPPLGLLGTSVRVEGPAKIDSHDALLVHYWIVSPEYFHTVGLSLRRGRFLDQHDTDQAGGAVVISERLAQSLFPGQDALGKDLRPLFLTNTNAFWIPYSQYSTFAVVGIVPDVREDGLLPLAQPQMYLAYRQNPTRITHLLVRTAANPVAMASAVRREVSTLDPDQPVFDVRTLESVTEEAFSRQRAVAALLGAFAALALLLAAVGIYGIVASAVGMRTREIGIRAALGASRQNLVQLIVWEGLRPVLAGMGLGLAGAVAVNRLLSGMLAGLDAWDSSAAAAVCLSVIAVASVAIYIPASWAAKVDAVLALRCE